MRFFQNSRVFVLIVVLFLSGCGFFPKGDETMNITLPLAETEYQLGVGDKVNVTVYNQDKLSGVFVVNTNGEIAYPLLESVKAVGFTSQELEKNIKDALHPDYLDDPKVSVEILNRRNIFILGEVERPGKYEFVPDMTLLQAIATAEGYTSRAAENKATIKRKNKKEIVVLEVEQDEMLYPEDVIIIKRRWF